MFRHINHDDVRQPEDDESEMNLDGSSVNEDESSEYSENGSRITVHLKVKLMSTPKSFRTIMIILTNNHYIKGLQ